LLRLWGVLPLGATWSKKCKLTMFLLWRWAALASAPLYLSLAIPRLLRSRLTRQRTADRTLARFDVLGCRLRCLHGAALAGAAVASESAKLTISATRM